MNYIQETIVNPKMSIKNKSTSFGIERPKIDSLYDRSKRVLVRDPTEVSTIDRKMLPNYFASKQMEGYINKVNRNLVADQQRMGMQYEKINRNSAIVYDFDYNVKYHVTSRLSSKALQGFKFRTYTGRSSVVEEFVDTVERSRIFRNPREYPPIARDQIYYDKKSNAYKFHIQPITNPQGFNPFILQANAYDSANQMYNNQNVIIQQNDDEKKMDE